MYILDILWHNKALMRCIRAFIFVVINPYIVHGKCLSIFV